MKTLREIFQIPAILIASALVVSACGGGGGATSSGGVAAGASANTVSQGVITAKGSIFVNGIEFHTNSASISIDGSPGDDAALKVGMTVTVSGSSNSQTGQGTANVVISRDALEGKIDSIDSVNKTITVMGQVIQVEDNVTRLNDDSAIKVFSAANFSVGNIVEVNGFADDNGGLLASRVSKKNSGEFETKGVVSNLGATSFDLSLTSGGATFMTVDFSSVPLPAGLSNGSIVEVKSSVAPVAGVMTASAIHLEDSLGSSGDDVEVEGIVSSGTLDDFIVHRQQVLTDSSTVYEGGTSADFALGVKLEAEGTLNSSGAILARKISYRSNIRLEGDASSVSASGLTVLGKAVIITPLTRIDSGPVADGSHVEVRAKLDNDGNLVATRIRVRNASTKAFLQARVTAADDSAGTMTILGENIVSNSSTQWRVSSSPSDVPVSKTEFYAQLNNNVTVVKVKWDPYSAVSDPIKEAEIEIGK